MSIVDGSPSPSSLAKNQSRPGAAGQNIGGAVVKHGHRALAGVGVEREGPVAAAPQPQMLDPFVILQIGP